VVLVLEGASHRTFALQAGLPLDLLRLAAAVVPIMLRCLSVDSLRKRYRAGRGVCLRRVQIVGPVLAVRYQFVRQGLPVDRDRVTLRRDQRATLEVAARRVLRQALILRRTLALLQHATDGLASDLPIRRQISVGNVN